MKLTEIKINQPRLASLCWDGDVLIDVVGGWDRLHLDGRMEDAHRNFAYRFDRAQVLPAKGGAWGVLYENWGTKALLLREGKLIRELNRSYYCAECYDYPIALATLPSGRAGVIHCPEEYNQLEIEDAETGERLTARKTEPEDFFHSRLIVSPGGKYLASAGWVWHPSCEIRIYEMDRSLTEPATLSGEGLLDLEGVKYPEVDSVAFSAPDRLAAAFMRDEYLQKLHGAPAVELGVFDLVAREWIVWHTMSEPLGTLFAAGDWAFSLYEHPKLIDLRTGEIVQRWPEISTGKQRGPIDLQNTPLPPVSFDRDGFRLAVASEDCVTVLHRG